MTVKADTKIEITIGAAIAGAVAIGAVILGGATFIVSQVQDDVAATRADVAEMRGWTREDGQAREEADAALAQSLADLTAQLQLTTAELSDVTDSLTSLDGSIRTIDDKLSESITRQQEFEKSIVARLDSAAFGGPMIPLEWSKSQIGIVSNIKAGADPLKAWYDLVQPAN